MFKDLPRLGPIGKREGSPLSRCKVCSNVRKNFLESRVRDPDICVFVFFLLGVWLCLHMSVRWRRVLSNLATLKWSIMNGSPANLLWGSPFLYV